MGLLSARGAAYGTAYPAYGGYWWGGWWWLIILFILFILFIPFVLWRCWCPPLPYAAPAYY